MKETDIDEVLHIAGDLRAEQLGMRAVTLAELERRRGGVLWRMFLRELGAAARGALERATTASFGFYLRPAAEMLGPGDDPAEAWQPLSSARVWVGEELCVDVRAERPLAGGALGVTVYRGAAGGDWLSRVTLPDPEGVRVEHHAQGMRLEVSADSLFESRPGEYVVAFVVSQEGEEALPERIPAQAPSEADGPGRAAYYATVSYVEDEL